eukprot:8714093-Lingulodinium_polyedra.AAC.1
MAIVETKMPTGNTGYVKIEVTLCCDAHVQPPAHCVCRLPDLGKTGLALVVFQFLRFGTPR